MSVCVCVHVCVCVWMSVNKNPEFPENQNKHYIGNSQSQCVTFLCLKRLMDASCVEGKRGGLTKDLAKG